MRCTPEKLDRRKSLSRPGDGMVPIRQSQEVLIHACTDGGDRCRKGLCDSLNLLILFAGIHLFYISEIYVSHHLGLNGMVLN
jgi:hypothetical protein